MTTEARVWLDEGHGRVTVTLISHLRVAGVMDCFAGRHWAQNRKEKKSFLTLGFKLYIILSLQTSALQNTAQPLHKAACARL